MESPRLAGALRVSVYIALVYGDFTSKYVCTYHTSIELLWRSNDVHCSFGDGTFCLTFLGTENADCPSTVRSLAGGMLLASVKHL